MSTFSDESPTTTSQTAQPTSSTGQTPDMKRYLIPKTVLGIVSVVLAFAIGISLSGVAFYSYYEYRLTQNEKRMDSYINGFDDRFKTATETIDNEKQNAQAAIQKEVEPLRQFQAEGGTLASLVQKIGGSVWFVQTQDENGAPSVASAFVVESNDRESVMVTSYAAIRASTRTPAPDINLTKGNDRIKGRLDNWVEDKDLAVLTVPRGNLPKLDWVSQDQQPRIGERVFVASGLGSAGASITQGFIVDTSAGALSHDSPVGAAFRGGPLLNSDGRVSGVASASYAPFGFTSSTGVTFASPIRTSCEKLLRCPDGNNAGGSAAAR